ncbi:hypothetical protein D9Q98_010624 [Chlorella vulgaris]|uniref:TMEM205-like domain-containing protein n=1 Tax=Chlorella vulgaris TaxID=3077 RepID=A0A9D4TEH6_CHLVU|nr:hypothetical protein D9Q98_010624 [Chlorella vulgaris]
MYLAAAAHKPRVFTSQRTRETPSFTLRAPSALHSSRMSSTSGFARQRSSSAAASPVVAAASATAGGGAGEGVQAAMLDAPSASNKNWVRLLAISGTVAAAARGTAYLPTTGIAFVHLLAYGVWLGSMVWTTFVAGLTMFRNLPRQQFGRLQAKLFPQYFGLSCICTAIQLGVLLFAAAAPPQKQLVLVGLGLATSLLSLLVAEPIATSVMLKRYALENAPTRDEASIKALAKQFGKWHGISSLINLGTLITAIGHGWWLASLMPGLLL